MCTDRTEALCAFPSPLLLFWIDDLFDGSPTSFALCKRRGRYTETFRSCLEFFLDLENDIRGTLHVNTDLRQHHSFSCSTALRRVFRIARRVAGVFRAQRPPKTWMARRF